MFSSADHRHVVSDSLPQPAQTSLPTKPVSTPLMAITTYIRLSVLLLLALVLSAESMAQVTTSNTDGITPSGMAPGAPAGSYPLSGFEHVNYYNGNLNVSIPLLTLGGRGGAQFTVPLTIERHPFHVVNYAAGYNDAGQPNYWNYFVSNDPWQVIDPRPHYGAGTLIGRFAGDHLQSEYDLNTHTYNYWYGSVAIRPTFTAADDTEYTFYPQNLGNPGVLGANSRDAVLNFGRVFVAEQNLQITFISDDTVYGIATGGDLLLTGWMYLPDGTRYRIEGSSVVKIIDRNGNTITFQSDAPGRTLKIKDSLNREVNFAYNVNMGGQYGTGDLITYTGFGGAPRTIRVTRTNLSGALLEGESIVNFAIHPNPNQMVKTLWLPDDRKYEFRYNGFGELAQIALPTGGGIQYDYAPGVVGGQWPGLIGAWNYHDQSFEPFAKGVYRRVVRRRVYQDLSSGIYERREEISRPESINPSLMGSPNEANGYQNLGYVEVNTYNYNGVKQASVKHHYTAPGGITPYMPYYSILNHTPFDVTPWAVGKEIKTEVFDTNDSNPTLLRREEYALGDGHIDEIKTTLADTSQVSKQRFVYDVHNNQTDVYEYDYGSGSPPAHPVRHTHTDYLTSNSVNGQVYDAPEPIDPATPLIHLRNLPKEQITYAVDPNTGTETQVAKTNWEYDQYTADAFHAALIDRSGISGRSTGFGTDYVTRGNVTAISRWLNTTGGSVTAYTQYDIAGNVVTTIDPRSTPTNIIATTFDFTDRFGSPDGEAQSNGAPAELGTLQSYAFPTKVTNALGQIAYTQFDYYTGQPVNTQDINGVVSSVDYTDPLDRQKLVIRDVNNLAAKSQTVIDYDDPNHIITVSSDLNTFQDGKLKSATLYDGLGRTTQTRKYETSTDYIVSEQQYDALGRVNKVSHPYRSGDAVHWTTTAYDALGRVSSVTTADNAVVRTDYSGSRVLVTDQAGKQRLSQTNALGQLKDVWEIKPADTATVAVSFPGHTEVTAGYQTTYSYDVLNNLTTVTQGSQTRSFSYDSLSRLTSATNPEICHQQSAQCTPLAVSYQYDANGNLKNKTDARSITTHFEYDALNRVTSKTYLNDSTSTPAVYYYYDAQPLPDGAPTLVRGFSTGRLVAVLYGSNTSTTGSYQGYDALGQVKRSLQRTHDGQSNQTYTFSNYDYDLAGNLKSQTYPSGRTVTTTFDDAGRISSVTSPGRTTAYVDSFSYWAHGPVKQLKLGNGLWEHTTFDPKRLQPTQIGLGTLSTNSTVLQLDYFYGTTDNNGNVQSQTITLPGLSLTQTYQYDHLNRLTRAQETGGANPWTQAYSYTDQQGNNGQYGNRRIDAANTTPNVLPQYNPTIDPATNRFTAGQGYGYDFAGNLTSQPGLAFGYDAENRQVSANSDGSFGQSAYFYDGEGRRVKKVSGSGTTSTIFVYNILGQLVAEYSNASQEGGGGTSYLTADTLGSPRVITCGENVAGCANGAVRARHDYLPFGEEVGAGVGGRTTAQGYSINDGVRQKFTSKERDTETGLDYFEARYYSSVQGRFTSPDPAGPDPLNPQTLNKYRYSLNNPLRYVDPDGKYERDVHVYLTYSLGLAAGFDQKTSWAIAMGNGRADTDPDKDPTRPLNVEARRKLHFTTPQERQARWEEFENTGSAFNLGLYMHAVQDMYSHEGYGPDTGHITAGTSVDKTYNDVGKANLMAETTYDQLKKGLDVMSQKGTISKQYGSVPLKYLEPYIERFNAAKTNKDKSAALKDMRDYIAKYRRQQSNVIRVAQGDSDISPPRESGTRNR